jgi:hypothetical protein
MASTKFAALVREIEARVRPTMAPTFSSIGGDLGITGSISAADFETLVTLAGAASFIRRDELALEPG